MRKLETVLVLQPDQSQETALVQYTSAYAAAVNWIKEQIEETHTSDQVRLHRAYYATLRERFGLPSQAAVLCLKQAVKLYRDFNATPLTADGPVPYDKHLFSLKSVDRLSLATLEGRIIVPCAVQDYRESEKLSNEARLKKEHGFWTFSLSSELPDRALEESMPRRKMTMSDKLLSRISRLVSGVAYSAIDAAEQAAPEAVLEQAIRDIDDAAKDVKAEIGKSEATKFNVTRRIDELKAEHDKLSSSIATALTKDAENLAESGVARQLDIEQQVTVLDRSLDDVQADIDKLTESLRALDASRREALDRLNGLKAAKAATTGNGGSPGRGGARSKAEDAIQSAQRVAESVTGVAGGGVPENQKDLDDLTELHRQKEIHDRLEKIKAGMKK